MFQNTGTKKRLFMIFTTIFIIFSLGCSQLSQLAKMQNPNAKVANVSIAGLSFDKIDLMFDIAVENPNSVGINLNGFDYNLNINGNSFLSGDNTEGLSIPANGQHTVKLPLSLSFKDIYNTFAGVKDQDSTGYELAAGFKFNVPVIGSIRVPIKKSGGIPNVKMPSIKVGGLKMNKLGLSGAELDLVIKVDNPNMFGINLSKLNYAFKVNGSEWGSGIAQQLMSVDQKGEGELRLPIKLNFLEVGMSVYSMLKGDQDLNYDFGGNMNFGTSLPLLKDATLKFDKNGGVKVER